MSSRVAEDRTVWERFRSQHWAIQALVWVCALPAAAVTLACLIVPLTAALDGGRQVETTSDLDTPGPPGTRATDRPTTAPPPTTAPKATTAPAASPPATAAQSRAAAEQLLSQVAVADEADASTYDRDLFEHWIDADGNSCNTRCEVLLAEQVPGGGWFSIYDRVQVTNSADLDVDHVVALGEAWRSGASRWDADRRRTFANDLDEPRSLVAVTASSNRSKSDRDPAGWGPDDEADWCDYAISWMTVKLRWQLSVDPEEFAALQYMVDTC